MVRNRLTSLTGLGVLILLTGCAADRSIVGAGIDAGSNPSQGQAVRIELVQDVRTFVIDPPNPDTPSLMDDGEIHNTAITDRAVGRKRGGFGAAFGDVLLPEGKTVQMVVASAVSRALRESGYRVIERGSPDHAQAVPIDVRIDQFWAWFNPGFWAVTVSFRGSIFLRGALPQIRNGQVVTTQVQNSMQAVFDSDWQKIVDQGLEGLVQETKQLLGPALRSESDSDGEFREATVRLYATARFEPD